MESQTLTNYTDIVLETPEKRKKEEIVGKLCYINYFLILIALGLIACAVWIPALKSNALRCYLISALVLAFELYARPFSYYGLSETGLTEYRHGKKRRCISWSSVLQVGAQLDKLGIGGISGVIISLQGAPKYTKWVRMSSFRYYVKYRPNVLYVYNREKSLPIIEKYYGPADYLKKEDLE